MPGLAITVDLSCERGWRGPCSLQATAASVREGYRDCERRVAQLEARAPAIRPRGVALSHFRVMSCCFGPLGAYAKLAIVSTFSRQCDVGLLPGGQHILVCRDVDFGNGGMATCNMVLKEAVGRGICVSRHLTGGLASAGLRRILGRGRRVRKTPLSRAARVRASLEPIYIYIYTYIRIYTYD